MAPNYLPPDPSSLLPFRVGTHLIATPGKGREVRGEFVQVGGYNLGAPWVGLLTEMGELVAVFLGPGVTVEIDAIAQFSHPALTP